MSETQASPHISVLLDETIDAVLGDCTSGVFVDATFGRGGHARALLARLDADSRVYAFDKDPQAQAVGAELAAADPRLIMIHASFAELTTLLDVALREQQATGSTDAHMSWLVPLLNEYYDPMYRYQLEKKAAKIVFRGSWPEVADWLSVQ